MANLKEVRDRIVSVNSTKQITSAMKMVSAAKLKRAQDAITQMRPYAKKMTEVLGSVSGSLDAEDNIFSQHREGDRTLYIVLTSNKGLCGSFNSHLNKKVKAEVDTNAEADVIAIGKKGFEFFRKFDRLASGDDLPLESNHLLDEISFENTSNLAEKVMEVYAQGKYDNVKIAYNEFVNAAVQRPVIEQFLPVITPEQEGTTAASEYIFEPGKVEILSELIPKALKTQLFKALLDSNAAEHGSRMTAMHQATENAGELLKDLRLSYNKARQAAITTEILEITSGAEALAAG